MARSRPTRSSSTLSPARILLAFILAGGLIAVAGFATYFLFTGRSPLASAAPGPEQVQARVLPPGEPTLSPGIVQATPLPPTAVISTAVIPTAVIPTAVISTTAIATPVPLAEAELTATATPAAPTPATATPTVPAPIGPQEPQVIVKSPVVNVRGGPGTNYAVLGQVSSGQLFEAVTRNSSGDWLEICCPVAPGQPVWISAPLVALVGSLDALPLGVIPPTPKPVAPAPVVAAQTAGNPAASLARPSAGLPGSGGFGQPGERNPLTGQPLAGEDRSRRPLVVCINNDFAARPQWGLSRADVAYEYLMEGFGITRFSAVFYGSASDQIGPIRSARLINLSLGVLYDAGLVCSGASDPVRFSLKNDAPFPYLDIDLDDPANNRYTVSIGSDYRTRLRTSTEGMRRWLADWGVERAPALRGFTFGELPGGGAPASAISIPYPSATGSQVAYQYDAGSGRYLRFLGGAPHLDGNSRAQLALDTVIVQYVPHEVTDIVEDSLGSKSIQLNLFGSGRALVFRNGIGFEGTWQSNSGGDMPRFFDGEGREIPLKPGNSWISVVPLTYAIAYQ